MLFINFLFGFLRSHILLQNCFPPVAFGCGYVFRTLFPLLASRIFLRSFEMSCFVYIVWSYLCISLVFLLSLVLSDLSVQVVAFVLLGFFCSFRPNIFSRFSCLSIFAYGRSFIFCASILILHPGYVFLFVLFRVTSMFSQINFASS